MIEFTVVTGLSAIDAASGILHILREGSVSISKGIGPSTATITFRAPSFTDEVLGKLIKEKILEAGKSELEVDERARGAIPLQAIRMLASDASFTHMVVGATKMLNVEAILDVFAEPPSTFDVYVPRPTLVPKKPRLPYVSGKDLKAYSAKLRVSSPRRR